MFSAGRAKIAKISTIDLQGAFKKAISEPSIAPQIIDLNQKQLYDEGVEADGVEIGEYAPATIAHKIKDGDSRQTPGRTDHITLNDTGEFFDSMELKDSGDGVVITADSPGGDFDIRFPKPLGLTDESVQELKPAIAEVMLEEIKKQL